jgi:hypothetical protein
MKTKIFSVIVACMFIAFAADAQSCQRERMRDGWRSGELTPREYKQLSMEQRKIHRTKMRMLRDGRLDPRERHKLHKMKKHNSRHIWREKHDWERRH